MYAIICFAGPDSRDMKASPVFPLLAMAILQPNQLS
jgi:hypothetical protein